MSRRARRFDRVPSLALLLLFFALAVRVAVPQGYMVSGEAGLPRITVCTGQGAVEMAIDADGQLIDLPQGSEHAPDADSETCPFALAQTLAVDLKVVSATTPLRYGAIVPQGHSFRQRPGLGLVAPPPPSHAPPSLLT